MMMATMNRPAKGPRYGLPLSYPQITNGVGAKDLKVQLLLLEAVGDRQTSAKAADD